MNGSSVGGFTGILGVLIVAGVIGVFTYLSRQRRIAELLAIASELEFTYSARDPGNVLSAPFRTFKRVASPKVQDFVNGERHGLRFQTFDIQYTESDGDTSTDWNTCVIVTVEFAAPLLGIRHENLMTRLGSRLGIRDVRFESAEFNGAFRVQCDDQRFAFSLVDARMMEWLLNYATSEAIEVAGNWVLFAYTKRTPAQRRELIELAYSFVSHVPAVVFTAYPPR